MPRTNRITKVNTKCQVKSDDPSGVGWRGVLTDIQADIAYLKKLVPIVERKIERGEPWPGHSTPTQN
jgi:hypothetical protein